MSKRPITRGGTARCRGIVLTIGSATALWGCGSETGNSNADDDRADPPARTIVVTTSSGDTVEFADFDVECIETRGGKRARVVVARSSAQGQAEGPFLDLSAVDQLADTKVTLPYDEVVGTETTHISLFSPGIGDVKQLSISAEGSSGFVEVISASCEPTPRLEVLIDATLYSEYNEGGHATVRGSLRPR